MTHAPLDHIALNNSDVDRVMSHAMVVRMMMDVDCQIHAYHTTNTTLTRIPLQQMMDVQSSALWYVVRTR